MYETVWSEVERLRKENASLKAEIELLKKHIEDSREALTAAHMAGYYDGLKDWSKKE